VFVVELLVLSMFVEAQISIYKEDKNTAQTSKGSNLPNLPLIEGT
jgi:hypothetical protein